MEVPRKNTNFKWPKIISRFFISFMAEQARNGLKVDKSFKGAAITAAVKAINEKYPNVTVTETNCLNHFRTLKNRWVTIKLLKEMSGVSWDEATKTIIMGDEMYQTYVAAHPKHEPFMSKAIEQYEEISLACGDDYATGSFARSSGDPLGSPLVPQNLFPLEDTYNSQGTPNIGPSMSTVRSKRSGSKRSRDYVEEFGAGMVEGLKDLARAVSDMPRKELNQLQEWTNTLLASVMELKDYFPKRELNRAMLYLVKNKEVGQFFMALDMDSRAEWVHDFLENNPPTI